MIQQPVMLIRIQVLSIFYSAGLAFPDFLRPVHLKAMAGSQQELEQWAALITLGGKENISPS